MYKRGRRGTRSNERRTYYSVGRPVNALRSRDLLTVALDATARAPRTLGERETRARRGGWNGLLALDSLRGRLTRRPMSGGDSIVWRMGLLGPAIAFMARRRRAIPRNEQVNHQMCNGIAEARKMAGSAVSALPVPCCRPYAEPYCRVSADHNDQRRTATTSAMCSTRRVTKKRPAKT